MRLSNYGQSRYVLLNVNAEAVQIKAVAQQNQLVKNAEVIIIDGKAVVGVVPAPLFTKSQRDALLGELIADISARFDVPRIIISFDIQVYHNIKAANALLSQNKDASAKIQNILQRVVV